MFASILRNLTSNIFNANDSNSHPHAFSAKSFWCHIVCQTMRLSTFSFYYHRTAFTHLCFSICAHFCYHPQDSEIFSLGSLLGPSFPLSVFWRDCGIATATATNNSIPEKILMYYSVLIFHWPTLFTTEI